MALKAHDKSAGARSSTAAAATKRGKMARSAVTSKRKGTTSASSRSTDATSASGGVAAPHGASNEWTPGAGEVGIRVRMYRVGFGDFFLITLIDGHGDPLHIVVDCGVFKGTSQTGDIQSIEAAVADMAQTTGGRVALIIMTHRHADHIAGFARCADKYKALKVDAVWMPIWESAYEPTAVKFQAELTRTAVGLRQHFAALGAKASAESDTARKYMENATGELGAAGGAAAGSNAKALDLLKHGLNGVTPEYYKAGDTAKLPRSLIDAGLTCQILGPPPVDDIDLMKLMDLQKGIGQYLTDDDDDGESAGMFAPFGAEWEIDPLSNPTAGQTEFYAPNSFGEWLQDRRAFQDPVTKEEAMRALRKMENALLRSQPIAALTAAKQLNAFLNNQSLVVLFKFKGKNLLFVGDAQAGNWEHWLFGTDTPDKTAGGTMTKAAQQILNTLDFYKVGHHGSGNATPKAAVEMMGTDPHKFAAMCSTQEGVYGTEDPDDPTKGTEVPRAPLLSKLASESALVRSDQIVIKVNGKDVEAQALAPLPAPLPGSRFEKGELWVDCFL